MKRIVSIQDISALGKCSLTVALPIISAMGIECVVMPTAILSVHTQFPSFTFHDLTDEMEPIADNWKANGITFDACYSGYLGSYRQIDIVSKFFKDFRGDGLIVVDPAMADNGVLYKGFTPDFAKKMATLCDGADLIVPNITEASFMLGMPYKETYDEAYIREMLERLADLGAKNAAITGVSFEKDRLGVMSYERESGKFESYFTTRQPKNFHGTGDIYTAAAVGGVVSGMSIPDALKLACDYTGECIRLTLEEENHNFYGVNFEQATPYLLKLMGK